jgi:hypothetical protein
VKVTLNSCVTSPLLKKSFHSRIEVVFKDFTEDALNNQAGATKLDLRVKLLAANELANGTKKGVSKDAPAPLKGGGRRKRETCKC